MELGYVEPRVFEAGEGNRLAWEESYVERAAEVKSREELRVALFARELMHEYGAVLQAILREYRLTIGSIANGAKAGARAQMIAFSERVPTMRISVDMKLELFRNSGRSWSWNMVRDIDALSVAVPYCHVVVCDRDALHLVRRSGAPDRYGTTMTTNLHDLPELLTNLSAVARKQPPDLSDWSSIGPGAGYSVDMPEQLVDVPVDADFRLVDRVGIPLPAPRGIETPYKRSNTRQAK